MRDTRKQDIVLGNTSLISSEEERVSRLLREKNLSHTNDISPEVHPKSTFYSKYIKRLLDIMISLPIFIILLPLNAIFALCTFIDVGKPILYKQTRVGKDGKLFTIVKFRNMNNKTDSDGKLLPAAMRVTKFGKIMRKFSLDELLNFWNVLKGDMSIIGPRPIPVFFEERMSNRHKMRNCVRPGLECPRVISLSNAGAKEISAYHIKFENDIWYVENISFITDVKMLFLLFKMTFSMKKRGSHANHASYFVGYDEEGYALSLAHYKKLYEPTYDLNDSIEKKYTSNTTYPMSI